MGGVNNSKLGKPGGSKALHAAYKRAMPPDAGMWGAVTIGRNKLLASKHKVGSVSRHGAVSGAAR